MKRLWNAFFYSMDGLKAAWQDKGAFRQEVWLAAAALPLAYYLASDRLSMLLMQASVSLVMVVELLNTSIEAIVDRQGKEIHPLAKKAKDCGSAAVWLTLLIAAWIWCVLLFR
jgi:diacylglycerol kinase (ATP)